MSFFDYVKVKLVVLFFQPLLNKRRVPKQWITLKGFKVCTLNDKQTLCTFVFENGTIEVEALAPRIFKIITSFATVQKTQTYDGSYFSYSVEQQARLPLTLREDGHRMELSIRGEAAGLRLFCDKTSAAVEIRDNGVLVHREEHAAASKGNWVSTIKQMNGSTGFLGFGQKTGRLFKNGKTYVMWNSDNSDVNRKSDPLYQSCPFAIALEESGRAHGLFFDNPHYAEFRMSKNAQTDSLAYSAERGPLALYVLGGPDPAAVTAQFAFLTGTCDLPPLWALGHHHSRWEREENAPRIEAIAAGFRARRIPCDALHIDIAYMRGFRCFTWDNTRFPDPDGFLQKLRAANFHPVIMTDPGLKKDESWDIYNEGKEGGFFIKDPLGNIVHAPVWAGDSGFPDYADAPAAEWWGGLFKFHTDKKIDGFWIDMNEPSTFTPRRTLPPTCVHQASVPDAGDEGTSAQPRPILRDHASLHNYYGFLMARATAQGLRRLKGRDRFFLFTRSSFAGIQRFASSWTGDNKSNWEHLRLSIPMILNMGLCGQIMTGPDIGGFWGAPTRELLIRFFQCAVLFPFHRNHTASGTPQQEIWCFGAETEMICRQYIELRYTFLPYIYTGIRQAAKTGIPMMRPLCLDYPADPECRKADVADTEYLCGSDILVAPVLAKKALSRKVYFPGPDNLPREKTDGKPVPKTEWVCYWTHTLHRGGSRETVLAPLDCLPLFVKRGSVIPCAGRIQAAEFLYDEPLCLDVYPACEFGGELYIDDGETLDHHDGKYSLIAIHSTANKGKVSISIEKKAGLLSPPLYRWKEIQVRIARYTESFSRVQIAVNNRELKMESYTVEKDWITIHCGTDVFPITIDCVENE